MYAHAGTFCALAPQMCVCVCVDTQIGPLHCQRWDLPRGLQHMSLATFTDPRTPSLYAVLRDAVPHADNKVVIMGECVITLVCDHTKNVWRVCGWGSVLTVCMHVLCICSQARRAWEHASIARTQRETQVVHVCVCVCVSSLYRWLQPLSRISRTASSWYPLCTRRGYRRSDLSGIRSLQPGAGRGGHGGGRTSRHYTG